MNKVWNKEETELFIKMYPETPTKDLADKFKRSQPSLVTKAYKLGIKKIVREDGLRYVYEEEELSILEASKTCSIPEMKKIFDRDYSTIKEVLLKNNRKIISSNYWWTKNEEDFLKKNFETGDPEYILSFLNRKWRTITKKGRSMGMKRFTNDGIPHKTPLLINEYEKNFIENNYKTKGSFEISKILKRSHDFIENYCKNNDLQVLKLRKNPEDYSDKFLLEELKRRSKILGRCPTSGEIQRDSLFPSVDIYYDRFGSFTNACELAELTPNVGHYGTVCYSKNNDRCYSISEQIITNYFIDHSIEYVKEYEYFHIIPSIDCKIVMDWYINNSIVVEFFGMQKFEKYELKTEMKILICKENSIKIIPLFPGDIKCLDKHFMNL